MPPEEREFKYYDEVEIELYNINLVVHYKAKAYFIKYRLTDTCLVEYCGILLVKPLIKVKKWTHVAAI